MGSPTFDRVPPQNTEAERAVLGSMLLNPDAIDKAIAILGESSDPFYVAAHGHVYNAILNLYRDGDPVDMVTLTEAMVQSKTLEASGGVTYIAQFTDAVPTSAHVEHYAAIVAEMWRRREMISVCSTAAGSLYSPDTDTAAVLASIEDGIFKIAQGNSRAKASQTRELVPEARSFVQALIDGETMPGLPTGINALDKVLDPLQPGDAIILAARPSIGKTALACNIMLNIASKGASKGASKASKASTPVLLLSMEMTKNRITMRMLSILGGFDMKKIKHGRGTFHETNLLSKAATAMVDLPIFIDDDSALTPLEMRGKIRQAVKDHGIAFAVIDYLQLMTATAENRTNEISVISRELKATAKECGIPIIALAQLNREGAEGRPMLKHIRDGGSIEADADIVMLMRAGDEENTIVVDVAKNREGETGEVTLYFEKATQRFRDFSYHHATAEDQAPLPYRDDDGDDEPFDEFGRVDDIEQTYQEQETGVLF